MKYRASNILLAAALASYGVDFSAYDFYKPQPKSSGGYNGRHYTRKPKGHNFTNCNRRVTRWEEELRSIMRLRMARR